jgi:hypothetical protein
VLVNDTFAGNAARGGAGGLGGGRGSGYGGALFNLNGFATLVSDTLAGNTGAGAGKGQANRTDVYNLQLARFLAGTVPGAGATAGVTLTDTILADPTGGRDLVNDPNDPGSITGGSNLVVSSAGPVPAGVVTVTADPLLAPLRNHGGATPTYALLPGSPALDAGTAATDPTTGQTLPEDQRGVARPQGAAPDIGAFESRGFTFSAVSGGGQSAPVATAFAQALTVRLAAGDPGVPVAGVGIVVSFGVNPAANGASASLGAVTATTGGDGQASVSATANTVAGSYTVTASAPGFSPVNFGLTNLPGAPAAIVATAGTPQSTTVGTAFTTALQATVTDAYGNPVRGVSVTFTPPATGASGSFAGGVNTAVTGADGFATAQTFTANRTAGSYTMTDSVAELPAAAFALTNTLPLLGAADVVSVQVDDGTAQRSMLRSLTVTFDQAGIVPAGLFAVT